MSAGLEREHRLPTGITEADRVFGGGIVPGSVTLLGGEPGDMHEIPVRSPIDGRVAERSVTPGSMIETTASLFTVVSLRESGLRIWHFGGAGRPPSLPTLSLRTSRRPARFPSGAAPEGVTLLAAMAGARVPT